MRTELSRHAIESDDGMRRKTGSILLGLLLAAVGTAVKFLPAVSGFIQQYLSGIYGFMMDIGWAILLCMAVGAFFGVRGNNSFYTAVNVYQEGIGLLTSKGNEVYADYGKCQTYLSRRGSREYISIKSGLFPQPAKFGSDELHDYQLFIDNIQRCGSINRL